MAALTSSSKEEAAARRLRETAPVTTPPQAAAFISNATRRGISQAFGQLVQGNLGHGGGVLRIETLTSGTLLYEEAWGQTQQGRGGRAMTPQTRFEVASITKTFTATALLLLVTQGLLLGPLTQTLGQVAPPALLTAIAAPPHWQAATLQQLMQHTSSIDDYWADPAFLRAFMADTQKVWTPVDILRGYASKMPPVAASSSSSSSSSFPYYNYSDTNYMLLGLLIESRTGLPLAEVFRREIYAPLGLRDTYFPFLEAPPPPASAAVLSHRYEEEEDLVGVPRQSADWAGGGLVSSTRDLCVFLREGLVHGRLLGNGSTGKGEEEVGGWMLRQTVPTEEDGVRYGLGLYVVEMEEDEDGLDGRMWGHDGWGRSFAYVYERGAGKEGLVVCGTVNQQEDRADPWKAVVGVALKGVLKDLDALETEKT